jgi:hypothetical protein
MPTLPTLGAQARELAEQVQQRAGRGSGPCPSCGAGRDVEQIRGAIRDSAGHRVSFTAIREDLTGLRARVTDGFAKLIIDSRRCAAGWRPPPPASTRRESAARHLVSMRHCAV